MALQVFGIYWVLIFLNNFNDYITTAVAINYFFEDQFAKEITSIHIFCHVLSHNIGTIAWSIVLLPALLIKIPFFWLNRWLSANEGGFARCINMILCPCCWCFEKFIDRFDEGYFAISYLGSLDFWSSTSIIYYLKESKAANDTIIQAFDLGMIFQLVTKLMISFYTLSWGKSMYETNLAYQQNIDYPGTIFFIIFVIGFIIGSLFVNLFSTTYESLLICYLVG